MVSLVENLETMYLQAVTTYYIKPEGIDESCPDPNAPLWPHSTWSLAKFVSVLPILIVKPYHRTLYNLKRLLSILIPSSTSFEKSREILGLWKTMPHLKSMVDVKEIGTESSTIIGWQGGWSDELEDICTVEIPGWK